MIEVIEDSKVIEFYLDVKHYLIAGISGDRAKADVVLTSSD